MQGGGITPSSTFLGCAGEMGANRVLPKPVRDADLLQAIAERLAASAWS